MKAQTFASIGVSTRDNITRVRFCNGAEARTIVLAKGGHDDITFLDMPYEMTKPEAVAWLVSQRDQFESQADQIAIDEANDRYNTVVVKGSKAKVSTKASKANADIASADATKTTVEA